MRNLLRRSKMPDRKTLIDPDKHLEDSLNTNNVSRIKSAINTPCVNLNIRIQKHQQMTILMRFCYMDISAKSRKDLTNLVLKFHDFQALNAQDLTGKTALMHACIQQDEAIIELLSEDVMIDPDVCDNDGDTALMHACRTGDPHVVDTLLACFRGYQLNVNATNNNGMSPLLEAARLGHTSVIRVLVIDGFVDVTIRDKDRNSALDYLVTSGKGTTQDFLLVCPAAQRKCMARQRRIAEGRKSMLDLINEASVTPRTAWADEPKTEMNKQKPSKNGGIFTVTSSSPIRSLTSKLPFSRDYTGQLNSVVFQMAQCVPMLIEKPLEEEEEDIQRTTCSRLTERRRSSSLPDLQEFQESILGKYLTESLNVGKTESEIELSPKKPAHVRRKTFPSGDGRLRLPTISKDDSCKPESESPRASVRRRGSLPNDIHFFSPKDQQVDQKVQAKPDPKVQARQTGRRGSLPLSDDEVKYGSKSNVDSSPRKPKNPSVRNEKPDRQNISSPRNQNNRRRSSLPLLNTNNKSVLSASSSSSTLGRRATNSGQRRSNSYDGVVYRPRVVESRVATSWEGKSSKTIPSYLFR